MVLESLINPLVAEKKPFDMFFIGLLYTSIALFLSLWIFKEYASLVMVFLVTLACVPLIYSTIKIEEKKDLVIDDEKKLLKEHGKALSFFMFLFLGITLAIALWYVFLPTALVNDLFSIQQQTIVDINSDITGNAIAEFNMLSKIFFNNIKVLVFCLLFSFVYGTGSIFILSWNATVIGVAIGNLIRSQISLYSANVGLVKVGNYFQVFSLGLLRYMTHGVPEILAYFVGGLAGGIISVAVIRHDFGTKKFEHILLDSTDLIILSVVLLVVAALIEVFITPILF
jgi:uncharacterized membrane protein SpoIIM required for sporulation